MKLLRRIGLVLGGLVALVAVLLVALLVTGWNLANEHEKNPVPELRVTPDSSLIARGDHIARMVCSNCHGESHTPPLAGGSEDYFVIPGGPPIGHLFAPNITPGGRLALYSDGELSRAIREGVNHEGRPMLVMPSDQFHGMSDRDLAAMIAWLRAQPAVSHEVPRKQLTPVAYLILGLHQFETSHMLPVPRPIPDVPEGMSAAYGEYIVGMLGCRSCHGSDLKGGHKGQFPPLGPNLLALVAAHDVGQFELAVRKGISARDGHALDPEGMPYRTYANLTDTEVGAVYAYLQTQAARH